MIWDFFDLSEVRVFAQSAAVMLAKKINPTTPHQRKMSDVRKQKLYDAAVKELEKMVVSFKKKNNLNFYIKAQLGRIFKYELIDRDCPPDLADRLTMWLLLRFR